MQRLAYCLTGCIGRFSSYQVTHCKLHTSPFISTMELRAAVSALEKIASTRQAESWDNVGLLVEPRQSGLINRVLLTNDLTEEVMNEVESFSDGGNIGLVISYHPPIFRPFKKLTQSTPTERIILRAIQLGVGVYSPHTALDNMEQGINGWLLSGVGEGEIVTLGVNKTPVRCSNMVEVCGLRESVAAVKDMVDKMDGVEINSAIGSSGSDVLQLLCTDRCLAVLLPKLRDNFSLNRITVSSNPQLEVHTRGGKLLTLSEPAPLSKLVDNIKRHLNLPYVRLAIPYIEGGAKKNPEIKTVAVCAGSGATVLRGVSADLYLTGEMSHHEVLAATAQGTAVVLCDHSNTERGYLQTTYKKLVEEALGGRVEVLVSLTDRDPLEIV